MSTACSTATTTAGPSTRLRVQSTYRIRPAREHIAAGVPIWQELTLQDRAWVAPLLRAEDSLSADGCFGTLYLWGAALGQTVTRVGDRLLLHYDVSGRSFFAFPAGSGSVRPAIEAMEARADALGHPLLIKGLTELQINRLEQELPGRFRFEENRGSFDYIYEINALADLAGKKLHKKRNHCNRFAQDYPDWRFEPLAPAHFEACRALLAGWEQEHAGQDDSSMRAEQVALERAFAHYEQLQLTGGALFVGERLVAFTMGEPVGQDGFDVRFEKADREINGAYAMINREFARHLWETFPRLKYLNREEDLGLENLRKAKESYYPAFLLKKYTAHKID